MLSCDDSKATARKLTGQVFVANVPIKMMSCLLVWKSLLLMT